VTLTIGAWRQQWQRKCQGKIAYKFKVIFITGFCLTVLTDIQHTHKVPTLHGQDGQFPYQLLAILCAQRRIIKYSTAVSQQHTTIRVICNTWFDKFQQRRHRKCVGMFSKAFVHVKHTHVPPLCHNEIGTVLSPARSRCPNPNTHTHPFNGPFSGTTRVSRYQKGKTNLDFTEARDSEWQWHQLGHMQVCTALQIDNHASTPPLSFLQAGCPSCHPTNSVKALKATTLTLSSKI